FEGRIIRGEQAADRLRDHFLFVVSGDDDRDERRRGAGPTGRQDGVPLRPPRFHPLNQRQRADEDQSSESQRNPDQKHPAQRPPANSQRKKSQPVGLRQPASFGRQRRHRLIARQSGQFRNSDEPVSTLSQFANQRGQRRNRLRAVAAAVVQ